MEFFTGLDVGMDETAICVVDDKGEVALQMTVVTDPDAIKVALKPYLGRLRRVGHEAGVVVTLAAWRIAPSRLAGGLSGDPARARGDVGAAQQDRQGGCARAGASDADRLVPPGPYQERNLLPAAAVVDAPSQPQAQVLGS